MVETLSQLFIHTIKSFPKDDLMLYKKDGTYTPISTGEFEKQVKHLALGLRSLGQSAGDKLVILSENRPEWVMTDLANLCMGGVTVPIYTSLVPEQVKYIIENSDARVVIYSDKEMEDKINAIKSKLTKVEHYITYQTDAPDGVLSLSEVQKKGEKLAEEQPDLFEEIALKVRPDDVASIIYTSGTTGVPKGVMLMHSNFMSNIQSVTTIIEFSAKDTVLSFLPLSHVLERMVTFAYLYKGCSIGYAESIETVAENLLEIRPHIMVSVPRVFEKIYAKVMDNVLASSALKRKIFFWAVGVGREYGKRVLLNQPVSGTLQFKKNLAYKLVFSKIVEKTGGRVRFFVSGGAPLSKDIAEFFYAMSLIVLEGYGLTETAPVISVNTLENLKFGSVGRPIPGVDVRIAEDGEILTKGPHVMKGYYKMESETQEAIKDGWFHTGDIGFLDDEAYLTITDRKKDIIITAGGKNVAPQPIENILKTNPYVSSAVVLGDKRKYIAALIVPNFEKLAEYAKANNITYGDYGELIRNDAIVNFMESEINRATPGLAAYEKVKKVALLDRDFEIEKGEITPTLKVKRNIIEQQYRTVIDSLYQEEST